MSALLPLMNDECSAPSFPKCAKTNSISVCSIPLFSKGNSLKAVEQQQIPFSEFPAQEERPVYFEQFLWILMNILG